MSPLYTNYTDVLKHVTICNQKGMHARASAKFVKMAQKYDCDVNVTKDDITVNACSIMSLLLLAASCGTQITLSASGPQASDAIDALVALVESGFEENLDERAKPPIPEE